jgi:hypothetical protein
MRTGAWIRNASICLALLGAMLLGGCSTPKSPPAEAATAVAEGPEAAARREALTSEALADIDRAGAFLAAQQSFSFRAEISYDVMQPDGAMLEFGGSRVVTMRRPDRLLLESTDRNGETKTLTFDGETISVDLPAHGAYVAVERPGTLYAALDYLVEELGVPAPLEDLVGENFAARVRPDIESAYFVDRVDIGARRCDQLIYRLPEVDVQLWIEAGERPLLCRLSITHLRQPGHPQFRAVFADWKLNVDAQDAIFSHEPPTGARRLPLQRVESDGREG